MKKYIEEQLRKSLILEGISDIAYHFTRVNKLENILKTNEIFLTPVFGTKADYDINDGKLYALSLTSSRSLSVGYGNRMSTGAVVRLTFDGRALKHNLKSKRVDYWRKPKDPNDPLYKSMHKDDVRNTITGGDELEDRILSDNNTIGPANKLIAVIEIYTPDPSGLQGVKKMADNLGIPLLVYDERKYFNASIKDKAIQIPDGNPEETERPHREPLLFSVAKTLAVLFYKNPQLKQEILDHLDSMGLPPDKVESLISNANESLSRVMYSRMDDYYVGDFIPSWQNDIHNMKGDSEPIFRYVILQLARDMKKHGCKTMREYLFYKGYIGKKTLKQFKEILIHTTFKAIDNAVMEEIDYRNNKSFFDKRTGDWLGDNLFEHPPIKSFINKTIKDIKKYIQKTVIECDEFKYLIINMDSRDIENHLNLPTDPEDSFWSSVAPEIEFDHYDLYNIIRVAIYTASREYSNTFYELKEEYENQWKKE